MTQSQLVQQLTGLMVQLEVEEIRLQVMTDLHSTDNEAAEALAIAHQQLFVVRLRNRVTENSLNLIKIKNGNKN